MRQLPIFFILEELGNKAVGNENLALDDLILGPKMYERLKEEIARTAIQVVPLEEALADPNHKYHTRAKVANENYYRMLNSVGQAGRA